MPSRVTEHHLNRLKEFRPHFQKVEAATGVPWEAVAALWYRESFSVTPPLTPGGQFQFDPVPPPHRLLALLNQYATSLTDQEKYNLVQAGVNDFYAACYFAACHGRSRCTPKITPDASDEDIKDFFWGYNGKAKYHKTSDGSPYVMNGYDVKHDGMRLVGTIPDGKGGRKRVDRAEKRPGAFVVYKQLKGEL